MFVSVIIDQGPLVYHQNTPFLVTDTAVEHLDLLSYQVKQKLGRIMDSHQFLCDIEMDLDIPRLRATADMLVEREQLLEVIDICCADESDQAQWAYGAIKTEHEKIAKKLKIEPGNANQRRSLILHPPPHRSGMCLLPPPKLATQKN